MFIAFIRSPFPFSGPQRILPDSTILVLSDREGHKKDAFEAAADESGMDSLDLFADPQIALACKETALIETPDYRLRDDFSQMGKTRGGGATRTEVSLIEHRLHFILFLPAKIC